MDNSEFVHLHCHSHFSLLDGLSSIKDIVSCASDLKFKSIALTDHGSCAGLFSFQVECSEKGIKPILGMEAYITEDHSIKQKDGPPVYHLVLLAKNKVGYKNLIKLSSLGYIKGLYRKPRIDFKMLEELKEGLIVSTACVKGEIPSLLWSGNKTKAIEVISRYKEVFKDDFYIEIMMHNYINNKHQEDKEKKLASSLYKISKEMDIKAICTQDMHYARREEWEYQDVLLAIQTLNHIKNPDRLSFDSKDFYMKPAQEMAILYEKAPSLLKNTVEIGEKIETGLIELGQDLLPNFDVPYGFDNEEKYLKQLVKDGMKHKKLMDKAEYRERIKYEMSVIVKCGFVKYFLILWDIINFAKTKGIRVGVGRGSGVSSLVLYCLDITKLDPIKYNLIFERFLNPERISPPDVDVDFDYDRREEVYQYIIHKYGVDFSSHIGTYNKYKARAAVRSTAKALDIGNDWELYQKRKKDNPNAKIEMTKKTLDLADDISKLIPLKSPKIEEALKSEKDFRNCINRYPKLLDCATHIEGVLSSAGVHPAGIVMSKDKIIDHVPLRIKDGIIATQYDMKEVEAIGLLKFDLLAIKNLTLIENTLKMIRERHDGIEIPIDNLEPDDSDVLTMFDCKGNKNTVGLFQFESPGMVKLLRNIRVDTFEDLIIAVSLYRPGPKGAGVDEMYCNYKHGKTKIEYLHPKLKDILKSTYGTIVFQENVMEVARQLAGFTGGQADTLRKAMGKKDKNLLSKQKELFIKGCIKNNVDKDVAEKIFEQIHYFGGYGFNRCLAGDTTVINKIDNKVYTLKELADGSYGENKGAEIVLDSYLNGQMVEDNLVKVFETGEKEVHEIEFNNGIIIKCTLDHKFIGLDGKEHTIREFLDKKLSIIYNKGSWFHCSIKSSKKIGKQMTYNITMKSDQHNYAIYDEKTENTIISLNSHAAAYAYISYQESYLKTYYPLEFMCNLLSNEINNNDKGKKLSIYIREAKRMGIDCKSEHINRSGLIFKIEQGVPNDQGEDTWFLRKPLTGLKGVGSKAVRSIVENQPYKDLEDFIRKIDARVVNIRVFNTLVDAGCMKSWESSSQDLKQKYPEIKKKLDKDRKERKRQNDKIKEYGEGSLFDDLDSFDYSGKDLNF